MNEEQPQNLAKISPVTSQNQKIKKHPTTYFEEISSYILNLPQHNRALIATFIGTLFVGSFAVIFAHYCDWAFFQFKKVLQHSRLWALVLTPLSFAISALLIRRFFPGASGSGIPKVNYALHHEEKEIEGSVSLKISMGKILSVGLALLGGASIGREGPTVQIGAGIMAYIGQKMKLSEYYLKNLILAGGAAGLAAAFNTPIAGIIFAVEELSQSFYRAMQNFSFAGVILAGIMAQVLLGNHPFFKVYVQQVPISQEIVPAIVVGILAGFLGGLFSLSIIKGLKHIRKYHTHHLIFVALVLGLLVALVGIVLDQNAFGTGYLAAKANLDHEPLTSPLIFVLSKFVTTISSYLSGIAGGIFAPALAIGSGVGAWMNTFFSGFEGAHTPVLGMAAFLAGVVQTPMTAFIIVFEMTTASRFILPLMLASFLGYGVSYLMNPKSLYAALTEMHRPEEQKEMDHPEEDFKD